MNIYRFYENNVLMVPSSFLLIIYYIMLKHIDTMVMKILIVSNF